MESPTISILVECPYCHFDAHHPYTPVSKLSLQIQSKNCFRLSLPFQCPRGLTGTSTTPSCDLGKHSLCLRRRNYNIDLEVPLPPFYECPSYCHCTNHPYIYIQVEPLNQSKNCLWLSLLSQYLCGLDWNLHNSQLWSVNTFKCWRRENHYNHLKSHTSILLVECPFYCHFKIQIIHTFHVRLSAMTCQKKSWWNFFVLICNLFAPCHLPQNQSERNTSIIVQVVFAKEMSLGSCQQPTPTLSAVGTILGIEWTSRTTTNSLPALLAFHNVVERLVDMLLSS